MPKAYFEILGVFSKLNKNLKVWLVLSISKKIVIIGIQTRCIMDHIGKKIQQHHLWIERL